MGIKWFQLIDAAGAVIVDLHVASIDVPYVAVLRQAVKAAYASTLLGGIAPSSLTVYANSVDMDANLALLASADSIESLGKSPNEPLIVQMPPARPPLSPPFSSLANAYFNTRECVPLENAKDLRDECAAEERQVAAMLLDGWFRPPTKDGPDPLANKKSILEGPTGTGKSVMFCAIAITLATTIYRQLKAYRDFSSVWLMLDGFFYEEVPDGLRTFYLLAVSGDVDLPSDVRKHAYCCLFPSRRRDDLFELGKSIFQWDGAAMQERFYYSGGSVRMFTLEELELLPIKMQLMVTSQRSVRSGEIVHGGLLRKFIMRDRVDQPRAYQSRSSWEQVVDSEYVLLWVQEQLRFKDVCRQLNWATASGEAYVSLARTLMEIRLHHPRADNTLVLRTVSYQKLMSANLNGGGQGQEVAFEPLRVTRGLVRCSEERPGAGLVAWRDNICTHYRYRLDETPIATIVELTTLERAYLQILVSSQRVLDVAKVKRVNKMIAVGNKKPKYIVVCRTQAAVWALARGPQDTMTGVANVCDLCVAYYQAD